MNFRLTKTKTCLDDAESSLVVSFLSSMEESAGCYHAPKGQFDHADDADARKQAQIATYAR